MPKVIARWLVVALLLGAGSTAAIAEIEPDSNEFEFMVGYYMPGPDTVDDSTSFGIRGGRIVGKRLGLFGEAVFFGGDGSGRIPEQLATYNVSYDVTFFDFVAEYYFNPASRVNVSLFGGLGWGFVDTRTVVSVGVGFPVSEELGDDSFAMQLGPAVRFQVFDNFYIRLGYRGRWIQDREDDAVDQEAVLGFGFSF